MSALRSSKLEDFGEAGVEAGVTGLVESEQPLAHQVVGRSGFVQVERNQSSGAAEDEVEGESHLDASNGAAEANSVPAHAFGNDHAFIKIPLLGMSGEQDHELGIFAHAAEAFATAEHEPHIGRLKGDLSFFRIEVVAGYRSYTLKLNAL